MLETALRETARAKLNLYLHVLGRRDDGYHLLDSLAVFPALGDVVDVSPADRLAFAVGGPFAAALAGTEDGDNLVVRAARALADAAGVAPRASIRLTKNLPVASGVGGGSADAAAALRLLSRLWNVALPEAEMARLALALGADVPVCLRSAACFMGGVGEALDEAPGLPTCHVVLVNCGRAVPTRDVFAARSGPWSVSGRFHAPPRDADALARLLAARRNDLEAPARALAPEIGATLDALAASRGCLIARMSGSGATCFGLFGSEDDANKAASAIARAQPAWWVAAASLES